MFSIGDAFPVLECQRVRQYRNVTPLMPSRMRSLHPSSHRPRPSGRLAVLSLPVQRTDMSRLEFVWLAGAWMGGTIVVLVLSLVLRSFS
jgi:hypothetical protein